MNTALFAMLAATILFFVATLATLPIYPTGWLPVLLMGATAVCGTVAILLAVILEGDAA